MVMLVLRALGVKATSNDIMSQDLFSITASGA